MITWTLFGCVLIALTPTASANNKIDYSCNTKGANGPDWDGISDGVLGFMGNIPILGQIVGIFGNVEDIWKAAENTDDGFSEQWEICSKNWANEEIDKRELKKTTSKLATMSTKTREHMMPIIEGKQYEKNISDSNFDLMKDTILLLQGTSDNIKETVEGGGKNNSMYLIAYDAALLNELTATYLFIAKLNNITYDPNIIVDYANDYARRMREFGDYLNEIDKTYLKKEQFWDDWGIKLTTSGFCHGFFTKSEWGWEKYNCHVSNKRNPANGWGECRGCTFFAMNYKDGCSPQDCENALASKKAEEKNAKENVRALLDGMKRLVATAYNNFDGLANHHMKLTDGTDCHSQCPGFNVGCLRKCHLTAKKSIGSVKLVNDNPYLMVGSTWMPICGHYFWNGNNGASIFCKKLGYAEGGVVTVERNIYDEDAYYVGNCESVDTTDLVNGCYKGSFSTSQATSYCKKGQPVSIKITCKAKDAGSKNAEVLH